MEEDDEDHRSSVSFEEGHRENTGDIDIDVNGGEWIALPGSPAPLRSHNGAADNHEIIDVDALSSSPSQQNSSSDISRSQTKRSEEDEEGDEDGEDDDGESGERGKG